MTISDLLDQLERTSLDDVQSEITATKENIAREQDRLDLLERLMSFLDGSQLSLPQSPSPTPITPPSEPAILPIETPPPVALERDKTLTHQPQLLPPGPRIPPPPTPAAELRVRRIQDLVGGSGPMRMVDIADQLGIPRGSITGLIQQAGLVRKDDGRYGLIP